MVKIKKKYMPNIDIQMFKSLQNLVISFTHLHTINYESLTSEKTQHVTRAMQTYF